MPEIIIKGGFSKVGCTDPLATNYDPTATSACVGCCTYGLQITGCRDPLATNYNPLATIDCNGCCSYEQNIVTTIPGSAIFTDAFNNNKLGDTISGEIIFCSSETTCVNCDVFDWWNDTYISHHNGQSLQTTSPTLWQHLVDVVTNSGQTFYVQTSTGDLITEPCCVRVNGTFRDGVCFCEIPSITITATCISNLTDFLNLITTPSGSTYFSTNASSIGSSLGLTNQQITFIQNNLFGGGTNQTEARLLLVNAFNITGGFYVNFNTATNTPLTVNKETCDNIGGYWNGLSNQCMCQPIVDQCDIDITEVKTTTTTDFYNNPIQIITYLDGKPIAEACCNRLIKDYSLPWVWQDSRCYASPIDDCLPVVFTLNDKPMDVPTCGNDLELSMWVYFGKPENPCQPIPDPPTDPIIIDGQVCDIVLTPNTGTIIDNPSSGIGTISTGRIDASQFNLGNGNGTLGGSVVNNIQTTCCYSNLNPILARITTTNPLLNPFLTQIKEYNSNNDFFNTWVQIKATLPTSGLTLSFGVNLEIYQGLNCCCKYDIFVDDIRVDCGREESLLIINDIKCPGFELTKVIDNKKSWVYNPGIPQVGISDYDNIVRTEGSFSTLNGYGIIDRTFAPSLDADIPWRYTDYFVQSSVYERHSSLVLNTKELDLTFDMCADCPISGTTLGCPDGYILSGNTNVCYNMSGTTSAITVTTVTYLSLYNLENYKKTFQSFWIPFMEQFIPATTIWVAGERWCNIPCPVIDPCDYDFELTSAQISIQLVSSGIIIGSSTVGSTTVLHGGVHGHFGTGTTVGNVTGHRSANSPNIISTQNVGRVISTPLIPTTTMINVDLQAYRSRFVPTTTEKITV